MSRTEEIYIPALADKKIPLLTLDNKWHQLFDKTEAGPNIKALEEELNNLIKRQGKANTDMKEIRKLKKKLMQEIMENADGVINENDEKAVKKANDNKRLINECNEKLESYEDELMELPREIDRVNRALMLSTMEICYDQIQTNQVEIESTAKWIAEIRKELKKRLIRKQEKEQVNQEMYAYMHDIFGADVIDIFDMKYQK